MLKFYDVNKDYISYLKKYESKIPNISYDKHNKFVCGIVFDINGINYYAPISSFKKPQRTNFILKNSNGKAISSIRLSFMFPIPKDKLTEKDFSKENEFYRRLLKEEYNYCNKNEAKILKKANYIYESVTEYKNKLMVKNCCNFKKLENVYKEYITKQIEDEFEL